MLPALLFHVRFIMHWHSSPWLLLFSAPWHKKWRKTGLELQWLLPLKVFLRDWWGSGRQDNPKSGCKHLRYRAGRAGGMPPLLPSSSWASWWLKASTKHLLFKHPFVALFVQYILHFISSDKLICFMVQLKGSCSVNKKTKREQMLFMS